MKINIATPAGLIIACTTVLHAQEVYIDSLDGNGQLTVSIPSNSHYSVEWTSSLTRTPQWHRNWAELINIPGTNMTVEIPMFYRVYCYTNGLIINPTLNQTYTYNLTNAYGEFWKDEITLQGLIYLPSLTNTYTLYTGILSWTNDQPAGSGEPQAVGFIRITGQEMYMADPFNQVEFPWWKSVEPGTTWTNSSYEITTMEGYEDISVPAGEFTGCYRFHRRRIGTTGSDTGIRQWVKPGFMHVKEVGYSDYVNPPDAAPIVKELQSWQKR
ncbi:hypothetical protein PDESU_00400 [Pontiella desulfatans]|uniref:Uncharacterized protein n=1 Tax=Pontiella desulfatans TaxID=2750659 RepID=A0A6C2TW76_PONDE|nr:hypothetical protein [Pontiella desulfatans]VGO11853.1 hypothetical protein PDESU_00400 [Pontiella desulfatans]